MGNSVLDLSLTRNKMEGIKSDKRLGKMKVFKANGKIYSHYRKHGANVRQVARDEYNKNFKERVGRIMNILEASVYNSGFNRGFKDGKKRAEKLIKLNTSQKSSNQNKGVKQK